VGGEHDPAGESGLAHLVEHLYVTSAAGSFPAQSADEFMKRYPAGWNAQTLDRFTVIAAVVSQESLDAELREAAARMGELRISADDLNREIPRLNAEIQNMFEGAPALASYNHARERLLPSPNGGRKGGLPDQVSALKVEQVLKRWDRFYKPRNAILVLAGAVQPSTRDLVREYFGPIRSGDPIPPVSDPGPPQLGRIERVSVRQANVSAELSMAFATPSMTSEDFPAFLIQVARLESKAGQWVNMPGRFPVEYSSILNPNALMVTIPILSGESDEQAAGRLDKFIAEIVEAPLTDADRALARNRFAMELGTRSLGDQVVGQNLYFLAVSVGRRIQLECDKTDFGKAIDKVTPEQMQRVAREYLEPARRAAVVARPD
jgi:zinc protease